MSQLGLAELDEQQSELARTLVGNLDDDGYLRRELINIVERMVILGGNVLTESDIPLEIKSNSETLEAVTASDSLSWKAYRQAMEKSFLTKQLERHGGNVSACAKALDMDRSHLHKKLTQLGVKSSGT